MFGMPIWHHPHGTKLSVKGFDWENLSENKKLTLSSSAVEIRIHPDSRQNGWVVEYEIQHSPDSWIKGQVWMSASDLRTAFGLSNECDEMSGQAILNYHGGDVAKQGKYIRYGNYLNIPGPGTGHDGDANVSICIDVPIEMAVKVLLQ